MSSLLRLIALVAALAQADVAGAAVSWTSPGPSIPVTALADQDGHPRALTELIADRPVIVSFFFTACARICPPQTALLRDLQDELGRRGGGVRPLLLSISLNPLADTPAALRAYAALFDARLGDRDGWLMLTGTPEALTPVWSTFDTSGLDFEGHAATLWIGHPASRRWTRTSALSPEVTAARLADLLLASEP